MVYTRYIHNLYIQHRIRNIFLIILPQTLNKVLLMKNVVNLKVQISQKIIEGIQKFILACLLIHIYIGNITLINHISYHSDATQL